MTTNIDKQQADSRWRTWIRRTTPDSMRGLYWRAHEMRQRRRIRHGLHYEPRLCAALRRWIRPGWTCVDVGANHGLMTIPMAEWVGARGCVHAFEPHAENVRLLQANVARFGLTDRVRVHALAVNDGASSRVALYHGRRASSSEWNIIGRDADGNASREAGRVAAVSLDGYFASQVRIDLVKIDVEGAESLVLAGMRRILTECAPVLAIECHSADNWRACRALRRQGYDLLDVQGRRIGEDEHCPGPHMIARPRRTAAVR